MCPASTSSAKPGADNSGRLSRHDDAIIEAAWCYYHEGLNQKQIADKLGVSRASVVNYLAESRRRNYVRVTLNSDIFANHQLSAELCDAYQLEQVLVITSDQSAGHLTHERVVRSASDWLPQLLEEGDQLGVAWGETVYRLSEIAPRLQYDDLTIVQLVGSRLKAAGFAAENCAANLSRRFGAHCINLQVPFCLSSAELRRQLVREPVVAEQLKAINDCSKVIFAAGTCLDDSHIVRSGLISAPAMARFRRQGATGVICGRLIDSDGRALAIPIEKRMIGVTLEQMQNKTMGLLVSADPARIDATRAALRGGYVTHLAICSKTARRLLKDIHTS